MFRSCPYFPNDVGFSIKCTVWKVSKYGVFSGPYFSVFGLNTKIYGLNLRIQIEYRKIQTKKNSLFGHFSHSDVLSLFFIFVLKYSQEFLTRNQIHFIKSNLKLIKVNWGLLRILWNIWDEAFCKNCLRLSAVNNFCKKLQQFD